MPITVVPLAPIHKDAWIELSRGYKAFYKTATTDAEYESAWSRLQSNDGVFGLVALHDGHVAGIAHYLFHASTWTTSVCYLQDLFTRPGSRGAGVARQLIESVAEAAKRAGASRYYWLTQENNAVARVLYEKIAKYNGFIRYDFALSDAQSRA